LNSAVVQHEKHPAFIVQTEEPFNGNPPMDFLCQEFVTSTDLFFSRNHGNVPEIDPADYRLSVNGMVRTPLVLTLDELKERFPKVELMATLQCAGNRRDELIEVAPIPGELPWGAGAISNAVWGGVRLRDVLIAAGIERQARHAAFIGLDDVTRLGKTFGYGGSVPVEKAFLPETLLAFEMNGQPLTPVHGYPLRVIVPGYIGARSVKWLREIRLQIEPSDNYFQQRAYKLFPPHVQPDTVRWEEGIMLGENSLNTVISYPAAGDNLPAGTTTVLGYAIGDGHNQVQTVELSIDGGETWQAADFLTGRHDVWTWVLWQARVNLKPGTVEIIARSKDSAGNGQPRDAHEIWNFKGYANNAWHRVQVQVHE
jgi:sulfite oxidase